jgi:3-oxoacid CoA-transferase subunit A
MNKTEKERNDLIYITGDTHGSFTHVKEFCLRMNTTREDILIILGDAAINYFGDKRDSKTKEYLASIPITLLCIHGNHEQRPGTITSYQEKLWHGGLVYVEEEYPQFLFAKDGSVFELNGKKTIAIGGAYSIDKQYRLMYGYRWWSDEQPSEEIKAYVEQQLDNLKWKVDVVLSHTTPLKYEPEEVFLKGIDQRKMDKSTEIWLDEIEKRLDYGKWYCGHYHTEKKIDQVEIMFGNFEEF